MGLVDRWDLVAWGRGTMGWMILCDGVGVGVRCLVGSSISGLR